LPQKNATTKNATKMPQKCKVPQDRPQVPGDLLLMYLMMTPETKLMAIARVTKAKNQAVSTVSISFKKTELPQAVF
jgi:hypothetical protein